MVGILIRQKELVREENVCLHRVVRARLMQGTMYRATRGEGGGKGRGGGQEYKKQRMKFWQDTAFAAGGLFKCLRYSYDKLFWYGIAQEGEDDKTVNLALDFKDLMQLYDADGEFLRDRSQMEGMGNTKQSGLGGGCGGGDWGFRWDSGATKREVMAPCCPFSPPFHGSPSTCTVTSPLGVLDEGTGLLMGLDSKQASQFSSRGTSPVSVIPSCLAACSNLTRFSYFGSIIRGSSLNRQPLRRW